MDERVLFLVLLLSSSYILYVVQANFVSQLAKSFSFKSSKKKDEFARLKRITWDEGVDAIGLDTSHYNDITEEKHKRNVEENIKKTLKLEEEKDYKKLKVRSLIEEQNETAVSKKRSTATNDTASDKHIRTERSRSFEKVNSREEKEMSFIKTLSSQSVPVEKQKLDQSGSGEEEEAPLVEVFNWPKGHYGLPKSVYGCPTTFGFKWKTGFRYHDTEDDGTENQRSDAFHLAANFSEDGISHEFCIKDHEDGEGHWPSGKYCIYKRGKKCPVGLDEGFVIWDDENTDNQNDKGGTLPTGQYDEDTKIYFCCSKHGYTDKDISLPSKRPFFLFAYESLKCQKVLNMKSTSEFIKFDDEDHGNTDYEGGEYPYGIHKFQKDHMLFLCYYEPKNEESSVQDAPDSKTILSDTIPLVSSAVPEISTNLEEESNQNSSDIDQESLRQSEEMMQEFMKATGGTEDESTKKERTKTIIKTIKVPVRSKSSPIATVVGLVMGSIVIGSAFLLIAKAFIQKSYQHKKLYEKKVDHMSPNKKLWHDKHVKTLSETNYVPTSDIVETASVASENASENNSESVYTAPDNDSWSDLEGDDDELVEDQLLPDSELKSGLELLFLKQQRHYWNQKRRHERRDQTQ